MILSTRNIERRRQRSEFTFASSSIGVERESWVALAAVSRQFVDAHVLAGATPLVVCALVDICHKAISGSVMHISHWKPHHLPRSRAEPVLRSSFRLSPFEDRSSLRNSAQRSTAAFVDFRLDKRFVLKVATVYQNDCLAVSTARCGLVWPKSMHLFMSPGMEM